MYSRLFIVYRDYSNSHSFPHHNWFYLLSPLHSNHKAIKEKNQMFYHFLWNGKGDKIKDHSCDQWILVWSLKRIDLCSFNKSLKTTCLEWKSVWTCTTNNGEWKLLFDLELEWPLHSQCFWHWEGSRALFLKKYWNSGPEQTLWIKNRYHGSTL